MLPPGSRPRPLFRRARHGRTRPFQASPTGGVTLHFIANIPLQYGERDDVPSEHRRRPAQIGGGHVPEAVPAGAHSAAAGHLHRVRRAHHRTAVPHAEASVRRGWCQSDVAGRTQRPALAHPFLQTVRGAVPGRQAGRGAAARARQRPLGGGGERQRRPIQPGEFRQLHLDHQGRHARQPRGRPAGGRHRRGRRQKAQERQAEAVSGAQPPVGVCQLPHREPQLRQSDQGEPDLQAEHFRQPLRPERRAAAPTRPQRHRRQRARLCQVQAERRAEKDGWRQEAARQRHTQAGRRQHGRRPRGAQVHAHPHRGRLCQGAGHLGPLGGRARLLRRVPAARQAAECARGHAQADYGERRDQPPQEDPRPAAWQGVRCHQRQVAAVWPRDDHDRPGSRRLAHQGPADQLLPPLLAVAAAAGARLSAGIYHPHRQGHPQQGRWACGGGGVLHHPRISGVAGAAAEPARRHHQILQGAGHVHRRRGQGLLQQPATAPARVCVEWAGRWRVHRARLQQAAGERAQAVAGGAPAGHLFRPRDGHAHLPQLCAQRAGAVLAGGQCALHTVCGGRVEAVAAQGAVRLFQASPAARDQGGAAGGLRRRARRLSSRRGQPDGHRGGAGAEFRRLQQHQPAGAGRPVRHAAPGRQGCGLGAVHFYAAGAGDAGALPRGRRCAARVPGGGLRRDPGQCGRPQTARPQHGHHPRGHRTGEQPHQRVQQRFRHTGGGARQGAVLRRRAHLRPPAHLQQLRRRRAQGDRRAQRLRRQAGEHFQHRVCGGDCRRSAPLPPVLPPQHAGEGRAVHQQLQRRGQLHPHHHRHRVEYLGAVLQPARPDPGSATDAAGGGARHRGHRSTTVVSRLSWTCPAAAPCAGQLRGARHRVPCGRADGAGARTAAAHLDAAVQRVAGVVPGGGGGEYHRLQQRHVFERPHARQRRVPARAGRQQHRDARAVHPDLPRRCHAAGRHRIEWRRPAQAAATQRLALHRQYGAVRSPGQDLSVRVGGGYPARVLRALHPRGGARRDTCGQPRARRAAARAGGEGIRQDKQPAWCCWGRERAPGRDGGGGSGGSIPGADASGYDYLLSMPLWSLTRERVEELRRQRDGKVGELEVTRATTPKELWLRDLEQVERVLAEGEAELEARGKRVSGNGDARARSSQTAATADATSMEIPPPPPPPPSERPPRSQRSSVASSADTDGTESASLRSGDIEENNTSAATKAARRKTSRAAPCQRAPPAAEATMSELSLSERLAQRLQLQPTSSTSAATTSANQSHGRKLFSASDYLASLKSRLEQEPPPRAANDTETADERSASAASRAPTADPAPARSRRPRRVVSYSVDEEEEEEEDDDGEDTSFQWDASTTIISDDDDA
eukprot:ctg_165.g63